MLKVDARVGASSVARFAHAQDQVGLGDQAEVTSLGEHVERPVVPEGRTDPLEDPGDGLHVVGQHLGAALEHLTPQVRLAMMAGAIDWVLTFQQADAAKETTEDGKKRAHRRYADAAVALSKAFALAAASESWSIAPLGTRP